MTSKFSTKFLAALLAVAMLVGMVGVSALAISFDELDGEVFETPVEEVPEAPEAAPAAEVVELPTVTPVAAPTKAGAIPAEGGELASGEYALTDDLAVSNAVKVPAGETVTIDLGGHTLDGTPSTGSFTVINQGTLVLKNGKVTKSTNSGSCGVANYGTISVENVSIDVNYIGVYAISGECGLDHTQVNGGVFGIWTTGGLLTVANSSIYGGSYGVDCETDGGKFVATDSEISSGWCGIYTDRDTATDIELTGCTVYGETRAVIQWASGSISASGTTFKSEAGSQPVEFNHGAVELSNGTTILEGDEPGRMIVKDATVTADRTVVAAKGSLMTTTWQSYATDKYTAETITGFEVGEDSVTITTAEGFGWWAAHYADYSGKTVEIEENLDLDGYLWDPMDVASGKTVTINGKGHTISNLIVTGYRYMNGNGTTYYSGFIGKLNRSAEASISNVTFKNADVEIGGNIIGAVVGLCYGHAELTNVKVKDSLVGGFGKVGGFVGQLAGGTVVLTNCSVENTIISGSSNCAGLVGLKMGGTTLTITGCAVENVTWRKSIGTDYKCMDTTLTNSCDISGNTVEMSNVGELTDASVKGRFAYYDNGEVFYAAWGDLYTDYEGWCVVEGEGEDAALKYIFVGLCYNLSNDGDMFRGENDLHAWGAWEETTAPGCATAGELTRVCDICGGVEHDAIDPTGHTWDQGVITVEPTANNSGEKVYTCIICSATRTVELEREVITETIRVPVQTPPAVEIEDEEIPLAGGMVDLNTDDHFAYVHGYPDGTFRPNDYITRAETATLFYGLMTDLSKPVLESNENDFPDVLASHWANTAISTLSNADVLHGYPDGTFGADTYITRAEFVTLVCQIVGVDETKECSTNFSDTNGHWAERSIAYAAEMEWIHGYPDGTFCPENEITRAEAIVLVNNILMRSSTKENQLAFNNPWSDLDADAWYYNSVIEAAVSHDYERITEGKAPERWLAILEA